MNSLDLTRNEKKKLHSEQVVSNLMLLLVLLEIRHAFSVIHLLLMTNQMVLS